MMYFNYNNLMRLKQNLDPLDQSIEQVKKNSSTSKHQLIDKIETCRKKLSKAFKEAKAGIVKNSYESHHLGFEVDISQELKKEIKEIEKIFKGTEKTKDTFSPRELESVLELKKNFLGFAQVFKEERPKSRELKETQFNQKKTLQKKLQEKEKIHNKKVRQFREKWRPRDILAMRIALVGIACSIILAIAAIAALAWPIGVAAGVLLGVTLLSWAIYGLIRGETPRYASEWGSQVSQARGLMFRG